MKLLLVDDEPYTREGILSIIAFDKLGIDEVFSAEDGLSGLAMAKEYQPDIILTDVRMPHLDGISMSYQIREFLPGCCIIFMSGFAEKDYLKSAIKLSAIRPKNSRPPCSLLSVSAIRKRSSSILPHSSAIP